MTANTMEFPFVVTGLRAETARMSDPATAPASLWVTTFPTIIAFVSVMLSSLIGMASGVCIEWIRDRRTYQREQKARDDARRDVQVGKRNEFQRQTLLDLQLEIVKLFICVLETKAWRLEVGDQSLKWADRLLPVEMTNRFIAANMQTQYLGARVRDASVRSQLGQFWTQIGKVELSGTQEEAQISVDESRKTFEALNDRMGELLRELDQIELADSER